MNWQTQEILKAFFFTCLGIFLAFQVTPIVSPALLVVQKPDPLEKFEPLSLVDNRPSHTCYVVDGRQDLTVLKESLVHYLDQFEIVTAMNVGKADCVLAIKSGNKQKSVVMVNPIILEVGTKKIQRNEMSRECSGVVRTIIRYDQLTVQYSDPDTGSTVIQAFSGKNAWDVQAGYLYLLGFTICSLTGDNADRGIETLDQVRSSF